MHKTIAITVLALLVFALPVLAAVTDFTADGNIVVSGVTLYEGGTTDDLLILTNSTSESFNFNSGVFTVTNPGSAFKVGSSNSTVKSIYVRKAGTAVACATNPSPGTSYVSLPTTAADYVVYPSTNTGFATTDCCSAVSNAASYNAFPTCGAASCNGGYVVEGSGSSATCRIIGGGGPSGGGGSSVAQIGLPSPSPSPSPSVLPTPSVSPSPSASPVPLTETPQTPRPVAPASGSTAGLGIVGIKEGELIRPANDFRVYIVKGGFARWIQNPKIFSIYKHFKPSDVKVIAANDLTKYTEASLIRAAGDPKVYEVNGDGTRHWINMTAEAFTKSGRNWNMVYVVNPAEVKLYQTGADVMK